MTSEGASMGGGVGVGGGGVGGGGVGGGGGGGGGGVREKEPRTNDHGFTMRAVRDMRFGLWLILFVLWFSAQARELVPVYYINIDEKRAKLMERHGEDTGIFPPLRRVQGLTHKTCNLIMLERECRRKVGFEEIGITCSHIDAQYEMVTDAKYASSRFALLLEDDVRFQFDIDLLALAEAAPKGFGILQLMMSNKDNVLSLWNSYKNGSSSSNLFTTRERDSTVWSAQAYLIDKSVFRPFVMSAVKLDRNGKRGYKIISSSNFDKKNDHHNPYKPKVISQCIFADMFIYSVGQPAYILNVPLFNSALLGVNSTYAYHQKHVPFHVGAYQAIAQIKHELTTGAVPLPYFVKPFDASKKCSEASIDWAQVEHAFPKPEWAPRFETKGS